MLKNTIFLKLNNIVQSFDVIARIVKNDKTESKKMIISNNISKYDKVIDEIFKNYNISLNKDYNISIFDSALYRLVVCINNLINFGIDKDEILNFLDFFYDIFSDEETCNFKNYCYVYDINIFENEFVLPPIRDIGENNERNIKILKSINEIRELIVSIILKLKNESKKNGICKCLLDFLNQEQFKKIKYFDIFISILNNMQKETKEFDFLYEFNKIATIRYDCDGLIKISDNTLSLDEKCDEFFFILKDFEKIDDYLGLFNINKKIYIIFLNNEHLKIKNKNILSEKDILDNEINFEFSNENIFEDEEIEKNKIINISISKISLYYSCSLYYFFNFMLKFDKMRKFSFDNVENGILIHLFMEKYFKKEINDIYDFVKKYLICKFNSIYCLSRIKYISKKYSDLFYKLISKINIEMEKYGFVLKSVENSLFKEIELENNVKVNLTGRIDRIDVNKQGEIIVIDYKTKDKKINLKDLKNGINVQTMIYSRFFSEKEKKIGFFNLICKEVDNFLTGISSKNIFKDNKITILSEKEFDETVNYSDILIESMAEKIYNGDIYNNPTFNSGGTFRCENCEYKKICKLYN